MSTTVQTLINDAFVDAGVTAGGEVPSSEDAASGLRILNLMLHSWGLDYGIDLGHSDVALTDTITLPDSHLRAVQNNLSIDLSDKFKTQIGAATVAYAARGLRALQSVYINVPELSLDRGLRSRTSTTSGTEPF